MNPPSHDQGQAIREVRAAFLVLCETVRVDLRGKSRASLENAAYRGIHRLLGLGEAALAESGNALAMGNLSGASEALDHRGAQLEAEWLQLSRCPNEFWIVLDRDREFFNRAKTLPAYTGLVKALLGKRMQMAQSLTQNTPPEVNPFALLQPEDRQMVADALYRLREAKVNTYNGAASLPAFATLKLTDLGVDRIDSLLERLVAADDATQAWTERAVDGDAHVDEDHDQARAAYPMETQAG